MVPPPEEYMDLILIPAMLHIDPLAFMDYPPVLQMKLRRLVLPYIASGGLAHG